MKTTRICAGCDTVTPLSDMKYVPHQKGRSKKVCISCVELEERNKALADDRDRWKLKYEHEAGLKELAK